MLTWHIWTPDLAHYPLAKGYKKEDMKPPSFHAGGTVQTQLNPPGVDRINLIQNVLLWHR